MCEYSGCVTPLKNECSNHHHAWFGSDDDLCTVPRYTPSSSAEENIPFDIVIAWTEKKELDGA